MLRVARAVRARALDWMGRFRIPRAVPVRPGATCMNCGHEWAILLGNRVKPDFDTSAVLPPDLIKAFGERQDGICVNCGFHQAYKRFSREQLRVINSFGKDITTSNHNFHSYPVSESFVQQIDDLYFSKRLQRWKEYFDQAAASPDRCLFIRPFFGASVEFAVDQWNAEVAGLDMSEACLRTVQDRVPSFQPLKGAINGMLEGDFTDTGPYDGMFVMHILSHSCDVHETLGTIRKLLRPGSFAVFTHEVVRKPTNPFHMLHMGEVQLRMLLGEYFDRVDRIDDCEDNPSPATTRYTEHGDMPDFVAWA